MIKITYTAKPRSLRLDISGHAYSGQAGRDLVCAAVSALGYTLARAIQGLDEAGALYGGSCTGQAGKMRLSVRPRKEMQDVARLAFETVCGGLELLAENYPEYVRFTRNAECGMRNAECGMRNAECGMRNAE